MSDSEKDNSTQLQSISVASRIAPFWRELPKLWFAQFEAIITPQKVSAETKFDLVIGKLGKEELVYISDLLDDKNKTYEALKARLINEFQESPDTQFNKLMDELHIGEQRPSQLYRRMAEAGKNAGVESATIKLLWLRRLPTGVRTALIAHEDLDAEKLGVIADKVHRTIKQGCIAEVKEETEEKSLQKEIKKIAENFEQLRGEVQQIRSQERPRTGWSTGERTSMPFRSPQQRNRLCIYHQRFGKRARNCQQPCGWRNRPPLPMRTQQQGPARWQPRQEN